MYLIFRIKTSPKRKEKLRQTSVQSHYKTLQMVNCLDTKRQLGKPTNDMMNAVCKNHLRANLCMLIRSQYIKNGLTTKFSLVLGIKDKATCSVTDLFNLLHYRWCQDADTAVHGRYRVQATLLIQLIAYTSSRPGAIIEPNCYKGLSQVLKYKVPPSSCITAVVAMAADTST